MRRASDFGVGCGINHEVGICELRSVLLAVVRTSSPDLETTTVTIAARSTNFPCRSCAESHIESPPYHELYADAPGMTVLRCSVNICAC